MLAETMSIPRVSRSSLLHLPTFISVALLHIGKERLHIGKARSGVDYPGW